MADDIRLLQHRRPDIPVDIGTSEIFSEVSGYATNRSPYGTRQSTKKWMSACANWRRARAIPPARMRPRCFNGGQRSERDTPPGCVLRGRGRCLSAVTGLPASLVHAWVGDEFCRAAAASLTEAERFAHAAAVRLLASSGPTLSSVGCGRARFRHAKANELIAAADAALLEAKRSVPASALRAPGDSGLPTRHRAGGGSPPPRGGERPTT